MGFEHLTELDLIGIVTEKTNEYSLSNVSKNTERSTQVTVKRIIVLRKHLRGTLWEL